MGARHLGFLLISLFIFFLIITTVLVPGLSNSIQNKLLQLRNTLGLSAETFTLKITLEATSMKIIRCFPFIKSDFSYHFYFAQLSTTGAFLLGILNGRKRLTQDNINEKAEGRTVASVSIRKWFPIEPGMEIPSSHHYPAVRRYQSPSANPSLLLLPFLQITQIAENYGVNYKFQHSK